MININNKINRLYIPMSYFEMISAKQDLQCAYKTEGKKKKKKQEKGAEKKGFFFTQKKKNK